MPITPTYPGVYIEEISSGVRTITGVSTSVTAFVGFTAKGPIDQAVQIFNYGDFERNFGPLHRDSELSYAVQQFFLNGGAEAHVVRVAAGASTASVTLKYGGGATDALVVSAANSGVWGNSLQLDVDYDTASPDSTFNLSAIRYERQQDGNQKRVETEVFRNLSMNSRSPSFAVDVVKAGSKLISLERAPGLTFIDRGYSMSASLAAFPVLDPLENTIRGLLDGVDPFTLNLTNPPGVGDLNALVGAVNAAITTMGLNTRLLAERADALGANNGAGNFLKLTSLWVAGNAATDHEFSSVTIVPAASNDAAIKLKLGLVNRGREKDGASSRRPVQTGTSGADLSDLLGTNVGGNIQVIVTDNTPVVPATLLPATNIVLPPTAAGEALRNQLQVLLQSIDDPATKEAAVYLVGTRLRVVSSTSVPNASIALTGSGATACRLSGAGSFINVTRFSLGSGAAFGAQAAAGVGSDGVPPGAPEILGSYAAKTGLYALRDVDLFNLLSIPRTGTGELTETATGSIVDAAVAFCESRRAFYLMDPYPSKDMVSIKAWAEVTASRNAALFFPRIEVADPLNQSRLRAMPPSGALAGVFARTDAQRGVWKAPAGTDATLQGVSGLDITLTDSENGELNKLGINCLRKLPVYGLVAWGARTRKGADTQTDEYKYIPVRRTALFIEESLYRGLKWVVFEPNDEPLWAQIRLNVGSFMQNLFRQGAFQGKSPREAYFAKCDSEITTQNDIDLGIVNILVGFAPLKPAEFVMVKLQQMAGQLQT